MQVSAKVCSEINSERKIPLENYLIVSNRFRSSKPLSLYVHFEKNVDANKEITGHKKNKGFFFLPLGKMLQRLQRLRLPMRLLQPQLLDQPSYQRLRPTSLQP
jgi:hypothetical protein